MVRVVNSLVFRLAIRSGLSGGQNDMIGEEECSGGHMCGLRLMELEP